MAKKMAFKLEGSKILLSKVCWRKKNTKMKILLYFIIIFNLYNTSLIASDEIINKLKEGKKIVFIRHAIAPGGGDPPNFDLYNCNTQRNLSKKGVQQSKNLGYFFVKNKILIDKVLSSEWCRCKDTAKFAFKEFETFDGLNSFFSGKFRKNKKNQISKLIKYLENWDGKGNLILVTHYVVILEILDKTVTSGEIVVVDKNLNYLGSINKY